MNRASRNDLLRILAELGDHAPDLRFGQLICNLAFMARSTGPSDTWDVMDEELLDAARSFLLDLGRRGEATVSDTPA
jgi:hypothetical protein